MFSNVGWGEILVIFIIGLVLIGPERLPKVIEDIRAIIFAARTAINDARENITGEFGEEFEDLRKPLQDLGDLRKLNPKTALTRTLFDNDDTYLDMLSGKPAAGGGASTPQSQGAVGQGIPIQGSPAQAYQQSPQPPAPQPGVGQQAMGQVEMGQPIQPGQPNQQGQNYSQQGYPQQPSAHNWVDDDVL